MAWLPVSAATPRRPAATALMRAIVFRAEKSHGSGFALAPTLFMVLIATLGVVAIAIRGNLGNLASIRESDYQKAKAAAEFGFNEIIGRLNNDNFSYLLVTKHNVAPDTSIVWNPATARTQSDLLSCNVYSAALPSTADIGAVITGTMPNSAAASYTLTSYAPPSPSVSPASLPAGGCSSTTSPFGNLFGGSGTFTVTGTVTRNGVQVATYTLVRRVHVKDLPFANNLSGFVVTKGPADLGKADFYYDLNQNGIYASPPDTLLRLTCPSTPTPCDASRANYAAPLITATPQPPPFPVPPPELAGITAKDLSVGADNKSYNNYPFLNDSSPPTSVPADPTDLTAFAAFRALLRSECNLTKGNTEISCKITNYGNNDLLVKTDLLPVNIYLTGDFGGNKASLRNRNWCNGTTFPCPSPALANNNVSAWNRLRVFGVANPGNTLACNTQTLTVKGVNSLNGMFLWMPAGTISYNPGGGSSTIYGVMWICDYDGPPSDNYTFLSPINDSVTSANQLDVVLGDLLGAGGTATTAVGQGVVPVSPTRYRTLGVMN